MNYFKNALLITTIGFISLSSSAQDAETDFFGLYKILIDVENEIISTRRNIGLGNRDDQIEFVDGDWANDSDCARQALLMCQKSNTRYYMKSGFSTSVKITAKVFASVLKHFHVDKAVDVAALLFESEDLDDFLENMAQYAAEQLIDEGVSGMADVFKDVVEDLDGEDYAEKLTDEAKDKLKELYKDHFKPDNDQVIYKDTYDDGLASWERYNPFSSKEVCPVKMVAVQTSDVWIVDGEEDRYPTMKITFTGNCNCKYPVKGMKLKGFVVEMKIRLRYDMFVMDNGDTTYIYRKAATRYKIESECCDDDASYLEDPVTDISFTDPNDLLIGMNPAICYEKNGSFQYAELILGGGIQYFVADNLSIGSDLAFNLQHTEFGASSVTNNLNAVIMPAISYYVPINKQGSVYFVPSIGVPISFGSITSKDPTTQVPFFEASQNSFGGRLGAGLAVELNNMMISIQSPLVDFSKVSVKDKASGLVSSSSTLNTALNKKFFQIGLFWQLGN